MVSAWAALPAWRISLAEAVIKSNYVKKIIKMQWLTVWPDSTWASVFVGSTSVRASDSSDGKQDISGTTWHHFTSNGIYLESHQQPSKLCSCQNKFVIETKYKVRRCDAERGKTNMFVHPSNDLLRYMSTQYNKSIVVLLCFEGMPQAN